MKPVLDREVQAIQLVFIELTRKWNEGFVLRGEPPLKNSDVGVAGERFGRILERNLRL